MNINSTRLTSQPLPSRPAFQASGPADSPNSPQESFTFSGSQSGIGTFSRGLAKVGLVAAGAGLGAWIGSSTGILSGVGGAVVGAGGGAMTGFIGGAISAKFIPTDDYGLGNVFYGTVLGAAGGLAAGIAAGGFNSGTAATVAMGALGAAGGSFLALQV
ncbi:MAG: hypothetical protein KC800_06895 [Candidatus Eremiobacteraeota bacterium]|nr:hypothetical protein [Candidatus Eremiobacteraeota bacterium]